MTKNHWTEHIWIYCNAWSNLMSIPGIFGWIYLNACPLKLFNLWVFYLNSYIQYFSIIPLHGLLSAWWWPYTQNWSPAHWDHSLYCMNINAILSFTAGTVSFHLWSDAVVPWIIQHLLKFQVTFKLTEVESGWWITLAY